jgi:molybdopterin synthase catalytic subunit/molybdopterin synthase sulfur carrier subunit
VSGANKVAVRLFALARELAHAATIEVPISESATVRDVRRGMVEQCPALEGLMDQMLIAVDSEYADDTRPVSTTSEIACIPPVSGG